MSPPCLGLWTPFDSGAAHHDPWQKRTSFSVGGLCPTVVPLSLRDRDLPWNASCASIQMIALAIRSAIL
jgi:hypothetical protein